MGLGGHRVDGPHGAEGNVFTDGNITHNQDTTVVIAREGGRGVQNHDQGDSPERRKLTPFLQIYRTHERRIRGTPVRRE